MIPQDVIQELETQAQGVTFGTVCLELKIHDGQMKFRITKEISLILNKETSGSTGQKTAP
jgi:hypothetical protein